MRSDRRPLLLGTAAVAAAIGLPGVFRVYQVSRQPEADLIITGRGEAQAAVSSAGTQPSPALPTQTDPAKPLETAEVVVHVAGAVKKPGLYRLAPGMRVDDAVKAAGGATGEAFLDAINLAERLVDGQQLYVPRKQEQGQVAGAVRAQTGGAGGGKTRAAASTGNPAKLTAPGQGTVNINTASLEELQRLPRVGPSTAARILEHRKANGGFRQVEDLMDVPRIGEKTFENLRPFIRVK